MRIAFLTTRFAPAIGGVEKYIAELAQAVRAKGHEATVITGAHRDGLLPKETIKGITVHRYAAHRAPWRARRSLRRLERVLRCADVINVSDVLMLERLYESIQPRKDTVICLTRHGMSFRWPVPHDEIQRARSASSLVDATIDDGCFIAKWLGVPGDAVVDQGLNPKADDLPRIPVPTTHHAVFVGRLSSDMGIEMYVEAIDLLRTRYHLDLPMSVFGAGPLEPRLRTLIEQRRLPVTIHRAATAAQNELYRASLAFVSGRMAIQEAMARRRPVIAACVNPLRFDYVVGEPFGPYVAAARSSGAIAENAAHLLNHPDRAAAQADRAFHHVRRLTWDRTAEAYLDLWKTTLARKQQPHMPDRKKDQNARVDHPPAHLTEASACS